MMFKSKLTTYLPAIRQLKKLDQLKTDNIINDTFLLKEESGLKMYYAPHNEWVQDNARIVIVGITPGWKQTRTAYENVIKSLEMNRSNEEILYHAKQRHVFQVR